MKIPMKVLDYPRLNMLNESSIRADRRENLKPEQIPNDPNGHYVVNYHYYHEWGGQPSVRMSVILRPGVLTAWLDVSPEEYTAIPEVQFSELEWEAAVCVGVPPSTL